MPLLLSELVDKNLLTLPRLVEAFLPTARLLNLLWHHQTGAPPADRLDVKALHGGTAAFYSRLHKFTGWQLTASVMTVVGGKIIMKEGVVSVN